ncbi:MAG: branched-chain amino acid transporter permease [Ilumatobacteraceae bacterium]|nr:branched-chain amino acid transporter permease [Ilumatobacteraceae bacterium]
MNRRLPTIDPSLRPVVVASATLGTAVGVFGISFGVGAVNAGASILQACVMSLLVFTGASQFSAVSVIGAGGTTASALSGALVLAARNGVYGLTMGRRINGRLGTRLVAAQLTIDESTAMSMAQDEPEAQRAAFWITGLCIYLFWNLGTLLGALLGSAIDPKTFGLDAAFPAGFVFMLWPLLRTRRGRLAAAIGAVVCLSTVPFLPIGLPILCASVAVLVGVPAEPAPVRVDVAAGP